MSTVLDDRAPTGAARTEVDAPVPPRRRRRSARSGRWITPWLFLAPALILFVPCFELTLAPFSSKCPA